MMNKRAIKISMEDFRARTPNLIESIGEDSSKAIDVLGADFLFTNPNGNYGMIPCDIDITSIYEDFGITEQTDINVNIPIEGTNEYYPIDPYDSEKNRCIYKEVYKDFQGYKYYYYLEKNNSNIVNIYRIDEKEKIELCKFISYRTLMNWYFFFIEYYRALRVDACTEKDYDDAIDFYKNEETNFHVANNENDKTKCPIVITPSNKCVDIDKSKKEYYENLHKTYTARGGDEMFQWIKKNVVLKFYFTLELKEKYGDYWGCDSLYYPEVLEWLGWFRRKNQLYGSYNNIDDCSNASDCCDCVEYFKRGGGEMLKFLNICKPSTEAKSIGTATCTIPICINTTIDNIGEFSIFSEEWEGGESYNSGTTVIYEDEVYIKNGEGEGFKYDDSYKEILFGNEKVGNDETIQWDKYIDYLREKTSGEPNEYYYCGKPIYMMPQEYYNYYDIKKTVKQNIEQGNLIISGITDSQLFMLKNYQTAKDDMGNSLPGFFKIEKNSVYSQPEDGSTLDLEYTVGNVSNLAKIETEDNMYYGHILTDMEFYYNTVDDEGNLVPYMENDMYEKLSDNNRTSLEIIESIEKKYKELIEKWASSTPPIFLEEDMTCSITYYLDARLKNNDDGTYEYLSGGTRYIDTVKLMKNPYNYYLSEDRVLNIYYYELVHTLNNVVLNDYNDALTSSKRAIFTVINDENKYKSPYNGFIASPILSRPYKFGISSNDKIERDVYIDRGISSALDRHLKLSEISSLESLEQYGNGYFKINSNN